MYQKRIKGGVTRSKERSVGQYQVESCGCLSGQSRQRQSGRTHSREAKGLETGMDLGGHHLARKENRLAILVRKNSERQVNPEQVEEGSWEFH